MEDARKIFTFADLTTKVSEAILEKAV